MNEELIHSEGSSDFSFLLLRSQSITLLNKEIKLKKREREREREERILPTAAYTKI